MLILHPSSRCDVCLDAYTWQTIAQTPHAIPCGHVFCRPCLFALTPHICPLCRKKFDPSKAKKIHVDRPEFVDENRENDFLQRLAICAETPEDQIQDLIYEVDTWLDTRADDTCIVLRRARATLTRYQELKKAGATLENALTDIRTRYNDMTIKYEAEHREAVATETKLKADNDELIRENEDLRAEIKELRTVSEHYSPWKNPLPPPPKPISTEHIPSFAQAMADDRLRFDLSPTNSFYAQSFEVEGRRRRKGKAKSVDHRLVSPTGQHPHSLPSQRAKMDSSEENPALISHFDRHRGSPHQHQTRPSTPPPPTGLQLHFENTSQPLDAFELTHTYLREYSQGVLDGQLIANGKAASRSSILQHPHASTSRSRSDVSLHDNNESIDARSVQSTRSVQGRGIQPLPGPSTAERPSRHRQNTVSSIATSVESSSSTGRRSTNRSRSRSISRTNQNNNISPADLLSNSAPTPPRRPAASLPTSSPNPSLDSISSLSNRQQPESSIPSSFNFSRVDSPAVSLVSKASSWGTIISTSTNYTTYSLLGLRDFREGSYPRTVGLDGTNTGPSPISSTLAMVGVNNAASPRTRGRNSSRINPQRLSQYPPPPSLSSWHGSVASLSPAQTQDQFSSSNGYRFDDEDETVVRPEELLNPNYSRDSMGRIMEPQRMTRGRNQPLPAVSPSFSIGEAIITEEDGSDQNFMEPMFGNALGLELTTGPTPISAPTPVVPHRPFLRSFSDES